MSFWHDLGVWIAAVIEHWHGYVSGGIIAFVLELVKGFRKWEPSKKVFAGIVACGLFGSMFSTWEDEHLKVMELSNPKFSLEIIALLSGSGSNLAGSNATFIARLTNAGTQSSAKAETWQLMVRLPNGATSQGTPMAISADGVHFCTDEPGKAWVFFKEDQLSDKATKVIDRYGQEEGILSFILPTVGYADFSNDNTSLTLSVQDVNGDLINVTESMHSLNARKKSGYISGIKNAFAIKDAGCATPLVPPVAP